MKLPKYKLYNPYLIENVVFYNPLTPLRPMVPFLPAGHRCHVTQTAIFANSRWRTAAILEIALSPLSQSRIIRFRSNLVGRCIFQFRWWTF